MSGKEVVRNLFETDQHVKPSDSLRKPTTKLTRRHSEIGMYFCVTFNLLM